MGFLTIQFTVFVRINHFPFCVVKSHIKVGRKVWMQKFKQLRTLKLVKAITLYLSNLLKAYV